MTAEEWVKIITPCGTLAVAVAVGLIGWGQWRLARNKLRLDLFDRRYKVFDATRNFASEILKTATFTNDQLFIFYAGTTDAEFLFGSDVVDYLTETRTRAVKMRQLQKVYENLPLGEERTKAVNAEHNELIWMNDQLTRMTKIYRPYLGFSHIK